MSGQWHHGHGHHHHHQQPQPAYAESGYEYGVGSYPPVAPPPYGPPLPYQGGYPAYPGFEESQRIEAFRYAEEEANKHRHREHMAEMGAVAAGAFAWYEGHEAKVDPAHAGRHKLEAEVAGAAAIGAAGYAMYEHHQSKKEEHVAQSYHHGHSHHHRHHHH